METWAQCTRSPRYFVANAQNHAAPVRDKNGNVCTSEREQAARWVQHFQEVVDLPEPEQPANIITTEDALEINTSLPDFDEVRTAILMQRNNKTWQ